MLASRRVDSRVLDKNSEVRAKNQGNRPAVRAVERERERDQPVRASSSRKAIA